MNNTMEFCKICQNRKVDFHVGMLCKLTDKKPTFEDSCPEFLKDEKEAERIFKMRLDAAGNRRSQNGSLNPTKNINYGIGLIIAGILAGFLFPIYVVVMIIFGGISFIIRGNQQKKIIAKNKEFNEKLEELKLP